MSAMGPSMGLVEQEEAGQAEPDDEITNLLLRSIIRFCIENLTRQTNMHTFPQTSHTSTQQSQLLKLAALATFQQTTRRIWPHSTSFALQASSSQRSSKTSPASAFTHLITSGCVEMILSLLPHHISLHHSSLTLRVSSSAAVSIAVRAQGPIVPVLFMFKWFIFHFRPPLLELDFCKSALSVVLVGFIDGRLPLAANYLVVVLCYRTHHLQKEKFLN